MRHVHAKLKFRAPGVAVHGLNARPRLELAASQKLTGPGRRDSLPPGTRAGIIFPTFLSVWARWLPPRFRIRPRTDADNPASRLWQSSRRLRLTAGRNPGSQPFAHRRVL